MPVDAPEGTDTVPECPDDNSSDALTVGDGPLLSRISWASRASIVNIGTFPAAS